MNDDNLKNWTDAKIEFLKDPDVFKEYETLRPQYELISQIIGARNEQGITQAELAQRAGTRQSNISRLESGNSNPSLDFLSKVAESLGMELHIELRQSSAPHA